MKKWVLVLLLFLIGCSSSFPPETPKGNVSVGKIIHKMEPGGQRWESFNKVVSTDAASPNQIAESITPFTVQKGEELFLTFEGKKPTVAVYLWSETDRLKEVKSNGNSFHVPNEAGYYIYEVVAQWKNGYVSYTFTCEVI